MSLRIGFVLFVLTLAASAVMLAPSDARSEPLMSPPTATPLLVQQTPAADDKRTGHVIPPAPSSPVPEIITDLSRLPPPVARTRARILAAARSGELQQLADLMNETTPIFSFTDDKDPVAFWKAVYPDSDGVEALSILIMILETGFVQVDAGTPHEMYVWPYFVRMSLPALTPAQKVELFRIVTGADYKDMLAFGVYAFYRLGIGPDGTWQFFVAGD
jgi:hypothetical protein